MSESLVSRGPLKYSVETPAPQLEAGRAMSVSLIINNPFDVPVTIEDVETVLPAHIRDVDTMQPSFFREIWDSAKDPADKKASSESLQVVTGKSIGRGSDGASEGPITLQPGNQVVKAFTLITKQSLLFTPSIHSMNAQVRYRIDNGPSQFDSVKYQLNIRSKFSSLIFGSLLGSLVGSLIRYNSPLVTYDFSSLTPFLAYLATAVLVGAVLVIAFARKKDAQPFITVEDFWGGFFVGFVAGYVGKSIINTVIPS